MKAIVKASVCPLYKEPTRESTLEDEALGGMTVDILEEPAPGWYRVRTHYRYEGFAPADDLITGDARSDEWAALPKKVILHKNCCDVLSEPKVQGWHIAHLVRGCLVSPVGEAENHWQKVRLPDGREGWVPSGILGEHHTAPLSDDEDTLRSALVETVELYLGTHYRWGGKSPLGIDCSGLCSMAYMLCGILIYRDARIVDGFPIHEIPADRVKPGDLLFFPGHVAMYIGGGRYCHSTAASGSCGVMINSLIPGEPDFRADLLEKITQVGSIF